MADSPITPVAIVLLDGQERKFLLSMGAIRRLKTRFAVKNIGDILSRDAEEVGIPLLYEALIDKAGLTEEQFSDLLPAHLELVVRKVFELLGASFPAVKPEEGPMTPSPEPAATIQ